MVCFHCLWVYKERIDMSEQRLRLGRGPRLYINIRRALLFTKLNFWEQLLSKLLFRDVNLRIPPRKHARSNLNFESQCINKRI